MQNGSKKLQAVLRDFLLSDNLQCPLNLSDPNVSPARSLQVGDASLQAYCSVQYILRVIKVAMSKLKMLGGLRCSAHNKE